MSDAKRSGVSQCTTGASELSSWDAAASGVVAPIAVVRGRAYASRLETATKQRMLTVTSNAPQTGGILGWKRMKAENRAGMYELAVRGVRRLAGLAAESDEGDVVRDALVRELRVVLDLDSVTVVTCDQGAAARHAKALLEAAEVEGERARDRVRRLVLELRPPAPAPAREAVILLAREARRLGADEVTAAGALVDVAAVVLGCLARATKRRPTN